MRIATLSDLHTDFAANRALVVRLATEVHRGGADLVIVAGDVSHHDHHIEALLRALKEAAPIVGYLPGNHDLWTPSRDADARARVDTGRRYRVELRALVESTGALYLPAKPHVFGHVGVAATVGWYDYSFVEPWVRSEVPAQTFATKRWGAFGWMDAEHTTWRDEAGAPMSDPDVARALERELAVQLEQLEADPAVRDVVVATHHQPFREVVYRTGSLPWEFFCAFMGSEGLGRTILGAPKVRVAVYGHSHVLGDRQIGPIRVYGTALGYPRERKDLTEDDVARTRIGWIEL